jgi:hypothetical protein
MQRPVPRYPAVEQSDAETRKAHHAISHGIRTELGDDHNGQSNIVILPHFSQSHLILQASIGEDTQKSILTSLAMKEDTIPKPDGLAMVT